MVFPFSVYWKVGLRIRILINFFSNLCSEIQYLNYILYLLPKNTAMYSYNFVKTSHLVNKEEFFFFFTHYNMRVDICFY